MTDIHDLSAHELSQAYRARRLSPVEATRAALARIEAWEGKINAMYIVDAEGALAQAQASAARWQNGAPLSALDGVPITIKDNIPVKGMPTPVGTLAGDFTPSAADAPPAARLREAGCVLLGKTTMPDFGMLASGVSSLHGITRNPWNLTRNPAGSSSGAAAGIVAGYGPLALGTDIGGSVRLPAAYNGIVALKPSLGRIPIHPPFFGRVNGPMTRTVTDVALAMTVLTRSDPRDYMALSPADIDWVGALERDVKGKKLGLLVDIGAGSKPQPAVLAAITAGCEGVRGRRRHRCADQTVRDARNDRRDGPLFPSAPARRHPEPAGGAAQQGAAVHPGVVPARRRLERGRRVSCLGADHGDA
jgi:Asp-tRNA(Asn)/Glu-tRNA(Gln) amidotransferase A subunit family amidase